MSQKIIIIERALTTKQQQAMSKWSFDLGVSGLESPDIHTFLEESL